MSNEYEVDVWLKVLDLLASSSTSSSTFFPTNGNNNSTGKNNTTGNKQQQQQGGAVRIVHPPPLSHISMEETSSSAPLITRRMTGTGEDISGLFDDMGNLFFGAEQGCGDTDLHANMGSTRHHSVTPTLTSQQPQQHFSTLDIINAGNSFLMFNKPSLTTTSTTQLLGPCYTNASATTTTTTTTTIANIGQQPLLSPVESTTGSSYEDDLNTTNFIYYPTSTAVSTNNNKRLRNSTSSSSTAAAAAGTTTTTTYHPMLLPMINPATLPPLLPTTPAVPKAVGSGNKKVRICPKCSKVYQSKEGLR
jgi:hypothetical protein